jgi:hypothetical protein
MRGTDLGPPPWHIRPLGRDGDVAVVVLAEQLLEPALIRTGDVAVQRHARLGVHLARRDRLLSTRQSKEIALQRDGISSSGGASIRRSLTAT